MKKKEITPKEALLKAIDRMPKKIQAQFLWAVMDKHHTIDYNLVSLEDLSQILKEVLEKQLAIMEPIITSIENDLQKIRLITGIKL